MEEGKLFEHDALVAALRGGHIDVAETLLTNGAHIHKVVPLLSLAEREKLVELLADDIPEVLSAPENARIARLLVDAGADVDAVDDDNRTALWHACDIHESKVVKMLLRCGAEPDICDDCCVAPMHLCLNSLKTLKRLIKCGADVDIDDFAGCTPLWYACDFGLVESVKRLLAADADPNIPNNDGVTPLHVAAAAGNVEIVRMLLENGADKSLIDNAGRMPFYAATPACAAVIGAFPPIEI